MSITRAFDVKLKVLPLLSFAEHLYYYEGPCRFGMGEALEPGYDRLANAQKQAAFLDNLKTHAGDAKAQAFIAGGETVVKLTGHGLGGRNQEIALAASAGIAGLERAAVFSVGSDGTDGPTDAAGGYADGDTFGELLAQGLSVDAVLQDNDAYHALEKTGGLIITGPTGTNVNDVAVALLD